MTRQNWFVLLCGLGVAIFTAAAPVEAQPTASTTPIEVAAVADGHPGTAFPPAFLIPGVAVTLPRGPTTAVELFFSVGRGVGGFFINKKPGTIGMFGDFGVQLKRFHGDGAGDLRVFHTFGLLGFFGPSTTECCIGLSGTVIRDPTTTSTNVFPPILPFVGIGLDRRLGRARLRLEVEEGVFIVRGTIAVAVPLARRP